MLTTDEQASNAARSDDGGASSGTGGHGGRGVGAYGGSKPTPVGGTTSVGGAYSYGGTGGGGTGYGETWFEGVPRARRTGGTGGPASRIDGGQEIANYCNFAR